MSKSLALCHGDLALPAFLPDATLGAVRSLDGTDLESVGIQAVVMNVFHLMQRPGSSTIAALGGLHKMAGWNRPIVTDSGGFQAYSLIRQNAKFGRLNDQGIRFKPEGSDREFQLTPEKSVQLQLAYGADVVICLDDCTHSDAPESEQIQSVERTVRWAKRCRAEFDKIVSRRKAQGCRPLIFGVVQGGNSEALRRECAEKLLEIGFDGFGFGGWPLDSGGKLLSETLCFVRSCIPRELPMHALGIGQPESVVACARMGYELFDCALPTRDARIGRLYSWRCDPNDSAIDLGSPFRDTVYIDDDKNIKLDSPVSPYCDCLTCRRYSIGYLRHLHKCGEVLYFRLATLHNLRFMAMLMQRLGSDP